MLEGGHLGMVDGTFRSSTRHAARDTLTASAQTPIGVRRNGEVISAYLRRRLDLSRMLVRESRA
jgi:hypothetical protein